ncbi:MAG: SPFH domain-containing protein [Candidatus Burarchaeum sp.]|nr:SPFH domain-containing protein [Candidatus Burarchaeum sp.]MDO8339312.1 SPFH domain-containing protein [Candidatus Burarchaeum sp.]
MAWEIGLIAALVVLAVLALMSIKIVRPTERALVERFGKYHRFANPGINFIIPLIDSIVRVNVTERMVDADRQEIITKDNLNALVDAQIYFRVNSDEESVKASQYNVQNYEWQIVNLARTTLRNIIGNLTLTRANSDRNAINMQLLQELQAEVSGVNKERTGRGWGLSIVRTELKEIEPPKDVQQTMNEVVKAENTRIAATDLATATETKADGERRAAIKVAEGRAKGVEIEADAKAKAIEAVNTAAQKYFVGNAQLLKKYEVLQASLEHNTKFVITEKGISPVIVFGDGKEIITLPRDMMKK